MKKSFKKLFSVFLALLLLAAPSGMSNVYAADNTTLKISSSQYIEIDGRNSNMINFYKDAGKTVKMGSVQVIRNNYPNPYSPNVSADGAMYDTLTTDAVGVVVELKPEKGVIAPVSCNFGGNQMPLSSAQISLTLTGGITNNLSFDFVDNSRNEPIVGYTVTAKFDVPGGSPLRVRQNDNGNINIPDGWVSGKLSFFTQDVNGDEIELRIEGIANAGEINNTVRGSTDNKTVTIHEGFPEYGRVMLHLVNEEGAAVHVNQIITVSHPNLITIKAEARLPLSQSFGTAAPDQAIITKDETKDVRVFFGNTEVKLIAEGMKVNKITAVEGMQQVSLNDDGSATVTLPNLSKETITPVVITIRKNDGSSVERTVNIVRTAIRLGIFNDDGKYAVYAGYDINKGYLYNNQEHNDAVFDAYLQVIYYKDNVVAGYKQIKIDDEALVNSLSDNESGSLELYSDNKIPVYGENAEDYIDGVNRVSAFLTDGPIDFESGKLPSLEFGTGSGVETLFGGAVNE